MNIRLMTTNDYDAVHALWLATPGMGLNDIDDSREGIGKFLARNPATCFVADNGGEIVGIILSGHDGRRGFVYHLAVAEAMQRQGIATRLVAAALQALAAEGIAKVALVVFRHNAKGNAFWEKQNFVERDDLSYRNRALREMVRIDT